MSSKYFDGPSDQGRMSCFAQRYARRGVNMQPSPYTALGPTTRQRWTRGSDFVTTATSNYETSPEDELVKEVDMAVVAEWYRVRFHILHGSLSVFGYPNNRISERCQVPIDSDKRRSTADSRMDP
ncbi:hypothetical protein TNCV_417011 [Trichonephila clavipes]|nr:hypothetical protein TNCV_417011 [Trichonephila clavipes]